MKTKELQQNLSELNLLQQRISIFSSQKQQLELSLSEIKASLSEVKKTKGKVFSMVGTVLLEKSAKEIIPELNKQKTELSTHLDTISVQDEKFRKKSEKIQKSISESLKDGKSN